MSPARDVRLPRAAALLAVLLAGCGFGRDSDFLGFESAAANWGMDGVEARGACIFDLEGDGDQDVLLVRTGPNRLFENVEPGVFEEVGADRGLAIDGTGLGCGAEDIDRDGDVDVIVTDNNDSTRLLLNDGDGWFVDATDDRGLANNHGQASVVFADVDVDGWLDVLITGVQDGESRLFRNVEGVFEDRTDALPIGRVQRSWGAAFLDVDNDGLPDLFVGTDVPARPDFRPQRDYLIRNDGDFTFTDISDEVGLGNLRNAMGAAVADLDDDGFLDLYVTNIGNHALYRNLGEGGFVDTSLSSGVANNSGVPGWGTLFFDPDTDGRQDLVVVNGGLYSDILTADGLARHPAEGDRFYRQLGGEWDFPQFRDEAERFGLLDKGSGMGTACGDLDGDGLVDLIVTNRDDSSSRVYRNLGSIQGEDAVPPLRVRLEGRASSPSGAGARLELRACGRSLRRVVGSGPSVLSQSELQTSFGLDDCSDQLELTIGWPSGQTDVHVLSSPEWGDGPVVAIEGQAPN